MDLNDPRVQQYLKQVEPLLNDKHVGCLHAIIVATPDGPLKDDSGLTCEQVEEITEYPHQTASARIRELVQKNIIKRRGTRRPTKASNGKRSADVYLFNTPWTSKDQHA